MTDGARQIFNAVSLKIREIRIGCRVIDVEVSDYDQSAGNGQYDIVSGAPVDLASPDSPRITIKVKPSTDDTYPVDVCETSTISDVKVSVEEALPDAPVARQVLILDGNKLQDDRQPLSCLGVTAGSVFFLHMLTGSTDGKKQIRHAY